MAIRKGSWLEPLAGENWAGKKVTQNIETKADYFLVCCLALLTDGQCKYMHTHFN